MSHIRESKIENRKSANGGFTLIELLLVIGIILILIGILLPTVTQVRVAAQTANTRQMISRIESGIASYFSDFQAYPGPFLQTQLKPFQVASPRINEANGSSPQLNIPAVTSTENLSLGLLGGLSFNGTAFQYNATNFGKGPGSLNPAALKRFSAYLNVEPSETTLNVENGGFPGTTTGPNGQWTPSSASNLTADTIVPEIVDKYSRPAPILYMRATRGAAGMLNASATIDAASQYQTRYITHTYAGTVRNGTDAMDTPWSNWVANDFGLVTGTTLAAGLESYLGNPTLSVAPNKVPQKKDAYILISAGPDGKYGTSDDITNFRGN